MSNKNTQKTGKKVVPIKESQLVDLIDNLVNEVVDSSDVLKRSMELANLYATGPVTAMKAAKRGIDKGGEQLLADGLVMEQGLFAGQFDTNDQKVGMKSFVENGPGKADFS
jgi:enoyl-CoA hydratase